MGAQTINFVAARQRVNEVAPILAEFLDHLHENGELDYPRLNIAGYSLGAHISGIAAKNVRRGRVNTIVGLDPAGGELDICFCLSYYELLLILGPLFDLANPLLRLDASDAEYVEVIHTDGEALGIGNPIGHADW